MLELEYDKKDDIPAGYEGLYTEQNGKWVLTEINGIAPRSDVTRLQGALTKERNDHRQAREKLALYTQLGDDPLAIRETLDRVPELEAAAAGGDDSKIEAIVQNRLKAATTPFQRQIEALTNEKNTLTQEVQQFRVTEQQRSVQQAVRAAALPTKIRDTALADLDLVARDTFELVDGEVRVKAGHELEGMAPADWVREQMQKRPHWWPESQGGGGGGGRGNALAGLTGPNPWTLAGWNMTEQSRLVKANRALAERCAKAAGVPMFGGVKPKA